MAAPTAAFLVAKRDDGFGDVFPLQRGVTYSVGRAPKNRIVLADDLSSRDHAEVAYTEDAWYVRDLGSLNGTRINGKGVRGDRELDTGDEVQFGRSKFLFLYDLADLPGVPESETVREMEEAVKIAKRSSHSKYVPDKREASSDTLTLAESTPERNISNLYRLGLEMAAAKSLPDLAEAVLAGLFEALPADNGAAMAVKPGHDFELLAHRSRDGKVRTFHKASQLVSSSVLDTREAVLAHNVLKDPQYATRDSLRELRAGSLICVPIVEDEHVIGLIHLYTASQHRFTDDDLDYALAVAQQMGNLWAQIRRQDELTNTNRELRQQLHVESELVGSSSVLKHIENQIGRVASTSATVLIRGESGSGKELVARAIHNSSPRREGPFVTLNCAAITESLLESELFGHERGAYTGATEKMIGKFEAADRGTIFLDEIGEMPLTTQSKFLRVLEGHPFERLGGNNQIKVDVRVVAATNRTLETAVRDGLFRKDLFYRLQVVEMRVPPLRERLDDVPVLAQHFLKKFTRETGRRIKGFAPEALVKMQQYAWPGNVRELRNAIERAVALNDKPYLEANDLWLSSIEPVSSGQHVAVVFKPQSLEDVEKRHIRETLRHTDWNKSRAAEILGIERSTLDRKIKTYGLSREG
jgi:Nif-specific regulatory protein